MGEPHNGDDSLANILCLCPNHHVMFDRGSFSVADDFKLLGKTAGTLTVDDKQKLDKNNLKYHRDSHGYD